MYIEYKCATSSISYEANKYQKFKFKFKCYFYSSIAYYSSFWMSGHTPDGACSNEFD